jgi:hypothetical protein
LIFKSTAKGFSAMATHRLNFLWLIVAAGILSLTSLPSAHAVPSYARQTGQQCIACHVSFPELTPYGRYFKLTGYTIGERQLLPFAVMGQVGMTWTQQAHDSAGVLQVPRDGGVVATGGSVFVAGKATDNLGGFVQWTFDNFAGGSDISGNPTGGTSHSGIDNVDLRLVGKHAGPDAKELDFIYGLTLHNNPTAQDVWNSTPAFGFPFTGPPFLFVDSDNATPAALVDGSMGQHVAGMGGYFFWKKTLYGEVSFYRTADGAFSWLRAGQDTASDQGVNRLNGYNPYWRLALNHEWGPHSIMVGTFGMIANKYPSNLVPTSGTDRYTDTALDAQYQYITDPHTFTAQVTYIHEKTDWDASFPAVVATGGCGVGTGIGAGPTPCGSSSTLNTTRLKAAYYYQRKYGATAAYFQTTGGADAGLYPTVDPAGNPIFPDQRGYILQLDYLPIQNVRLMLQYTGFLKYNGASGNYDGLGRNPRDNNQLFLNLWVAF